MKNLKHIRFRIRLLFILFVCIMGQGKGVFGQCTLTVQDANYCNTSGAVLGVGMQLTLGPVPITSAITSYSWTGPNGYSSTSQYPVLLAPVAPGNYTLTVEAPGCITDASDNTINLNTTSSNCPTAAFNSSPAVVCDGATTTFTNQSGTGNTYLWLFGDGTTSTSANPTHVYDVAEGTGTITFTATLVVTNAAGNSDIEQRVITVRQIPAEPTITSPQLTTYNSEELLRRCVTTGTTGNVAISSIVSLAGSWEQSIQINWGDGNVEAISSFAAIHTYSLGYYNFTIEQIGPNGCIVSNSYPVFIGNTPQVSVPLAIDSVNCLPYTVNLPLTNVSGNVFGTTYTIVYSDGSPMETFNHPPPSLIPHTFDIVSCNYIANVSTNTYTDAFSIQVNAQNVCGTNFGAAGPFRIAEAPTASFTALPTPVCINNPVNVNSTADLGNNIDANGCNTNHGMVWSISPATGWNLTSGILGSTNGQPTNYTNWTSGSDQLSLTFSTPGTYTITQRIRNSCGEDVTTRTVCVVPPVTAAFNLNYNDQCAPETITTDNLTTPLNTCVPPIYLWTISPPAPFAVNVPPFTPASFEPAWLLTNNGTYTITLSATNACGTTVDDTIFTIVAPPTVNLLPIPPGCAPYIVDPAVTYTNGGGTITLQEWKIDNGPWTAVLPNEPVDYPPLTFAAGSHTISVRITNECGTVTSTQIFVVTSPPQINLSPFSVCSEVPELINGIVPPIVIGSGAPPYIYNWTGAGISPTIVSNPSIVLTNTNIPPLATISPIGLIVTDLLGCADTANVIVTVNPLPTLTAITNDKCVGAPAVPLSVSSNISGTTFAWSPSTGLSATTGAIVQANPASTTTYTITGTVTATGCISSTTTELTVNPLPVVDAEAPFQLCAQAIPTAILQGTPVGGIWSDPTPLTGTLVSPNIYTPSTSPGTDILTYTFTDANGCVNSDNVQVTILTVSPATVGSNFSLCQNAPSQLLNTGLAAGGIWTGSGVILQTGNYYFNPSIAGAGSHTLTYTINSGTTCETSASLTATVFPSPNVNVGPNLEICSGLDVTISSTVNSGTPTYQYAWTPATGVIGATNTSQLQVELFNVTSVDQTFTYNLTVTDANSCVVSDAIDLIVHPLPIVEAGNDQTVCTQPITFTLTGFSPTIDGTGIWTGSAQLNGNIYTPLSTAGVETLYYTFTDLNGCVNLDSMQITNVIPITPNAGIDKSYCLNAGITSIVPLTNPGGVWNGPGISAAGVFNPLIAGAGTHIYTYTINSNKTCQTNDNLQIVVYPIPNVNAGVDDEICSGLSATFNSNVGSGTTPYVYSWTPSTGILGTVNANQITVSLLNASNVDQTFTYTLSITDANSCVVTDDVNLTVHPLPVVEAGTNQTLCSQVIPFTLSGFSPTTNGVGIWSGSTQLVGNIYTPTTTPLLDTITYTFNDLNGCINKDSLIITTLAPVFPNAGIDTAFCLNVGLVTIQPVNNPGGIWSGTGINASGVFNPLTAGVGTHVLTYTINAGTTCQTSDTRSITVYPIPTVNAGLNQTICSGDTIIFNATVSGGLSPYAYSWNPTTSIIGSNASNSISVTETNLGPGISTTIYNVEVTDNHQCVVSDAVQLTVRPNPIVNAGPDTTLCFSVSVPYLLNGFSPAGGTWLNFPSNSGTLTGLNFQTGGIGLDTLSYSYTDGFGCSSGDSIFINVTSPLTIDAGPDLRFCEDDAAITLSMPLPVNPPASYSAAWNGPGIINTAGVFSFNPALAGPGNHTINYTFEFGATCAATDAVAIYVGAIPEIVAADFGICDVLNQDLNVTLTNGTGTSPFVYQWLPNAGLSSTTILSPTFTADNVSGTDEIVALQLTVNDDVGCSAISTIDVTVHPLPIVNAGLDSILCNQPIAYPLSGYSPTTGGTGVWTGSTNLVGNIYTPTGLVNGLGNQTLTYTFTDIYGCVSSDQVVITTVAPVFPNAGVNKKFCFTDASAFLIPTTQPGGIWSGAGVSLIAGNYEFDPSVAGVGTHAIVYTIFDGTTCETYDTLIYKVFTMPSVNAGTDQQMCSGDTIQINGIGSLGTLPYQFAWTPITGILSGSLTATASVRLFNNTASDIIQSYTLTLTDSAGCIASDITDVTVHPLPIVNAGLDSTLCNQPIPYTLSGYTPTTGGTGVWTGSANLVGNIYTPSGLANGLGNQTLTYTFTDTYGCINSDQVVITTVAPVFPNAGVDKKFCFADASASLVPTTQPGGIWSGPGVSVLAGNYEFDPSAAGVGTHAIVYTIFDGTTCETYDTLIYKVFPMPSVNAGNDQQMCSGDTIPITGIGSLGTLPYQYAWTPITGVLSGSSTVTASVQLFNNTASDIIQSYTLTLTDSAGCIASDITDITVHPLPVVNAGLDSILCNQPIAYPLSGYSPTTGGTGVWTGSANLVGNIFTPTGLATGLGNQTLTYTFTDIYGCVNSDQVLLTVIAPVFPNAGLDIETCISDVPFTLIPTTLPGGIWSGAGVSQQGTDYLFSPSIAGDGVFTIYYTVYSGTTCETKDSIEVTVYPLPEVSLGADIDLCVDAACYQVTDFLPNNGNWVLPPTGLFYGEGAVSNTGLFCPQLNTPGDYKIYYQFTNPITTCVNLDSMIIRVHPLPIPQFTLDSVICMSAGFNPVNTSIGDTIYGGGVVYQWRVLDYLQVEYASYSGNSPNITIADTGNFIIELTMTTAAGCVNQFQRSVFIIDIPVPDFSLSANTGCAPLSIAITNLSTGNYPEYEWTVNGIYQDLTASPQAITFPSPVLGDTTYIVRLNISNQCGDNNYQEEFLARPTPVSSLSADTYVGCSPFVPVFTNSSYGAPDSYTWIFSDGFIYNDSLPVGHALIAIDNDTTNYTVILVTQNVCGIDSATLNFVALPNTIVAFFNTLPQFGCAPLPVTLTNFSSGATNYLWNFDDGSAEVSTYNASHVFQEGGNYTVSLIATDGCSIDTAYATVNVYPRPTINFIPDEDVICQGNVLGLTNLSQGAVAYLWDFGNNETSASFEPNYTYDTAGSFIVQLIGYSPVFGCPDTFALPIEVINIPQINIDVDPMMGCMPLLVNFTNNTLYTSGIEWDFGNGLTSTSFNPSTNYYQFGEYLVDITAHNYSFAYNLDCPIDTQIVISVFPKPTSSFTLESNASCGDSVTVAVENISTGASSYLWSWQSSNSFAFEPLISVTDTGYFPIQLIVSNQFACTDTTSRMYRLTGQPLPQFIADPVIGCMPLSSDFSSLTTYGDRWEWDFGDGTTSNQGPNTQHEYVSAGNYTVSLLVGNDDRCFADTTINQMVTVHPRANAAFTLNTPIITSSYPVVLFENQSTNANEFDLFPGDGSHYTDFINQHIYQIEDQSSFDIVLIANNPFNCPDTAYSALKVEPSGDVYIPNSFTPNGDGRNELFGPVFDGELTYFNFLIFDRWGHIIFETFDVNEKWNGTFRNLNKEPIKQDVYVYKIVFGFGGSFDSYYNRVGNVTVIY